MPSPLAVLGLNLILVAGGMALLWTLSLRIRDVSIVDIAWGASGAVIALSTFALAPDSSPRGLLITGMVVFWGLRLALHIAKRKVGTGEDFRYAAMREEHGEAFPVRSLFTVFLFQAFLIWLIAMPVQIAQLLPGTGGLSVTDFLGLGIWVVGFGFEATADRQLRAFLADPENGGKVMDRGLWTYSRHPNYFGDSLIWWGIFIVAAGTPWGWVTVASPLLMTWFLLKFSGVPLLEESLAERREGYREYMERTSIFIPLPPKSPPGA